MLTKRSISKTFSALFVLMLLLSLAGHPLPALAHTSPGIPESAARNTVGGAAVMFIENVGQFDDGARFQVRGGSHTLWLAEDALWVTALKQSGSGPSSEESNRGDSAGPEALISGANFKLSFVNANPNPIIEPYNRLETDTSYFIGSDPASWRAAVPVWGGVRYKDLYPGLDLEVTSENGEVIQRLAAQAGTTPDLAAVRLRIEGADRLSLEGGLLRLTAADSEYVLPLLQLAAEAGAEPAAAQLLGNQVLAPFGRPQADVAATNPQSGTADLLYATFLGGTSTDSGNDIFVNSAGEMYIAGETISSDFPATPGAFSTGLNGEYDAFVAKLNADGTALSYATFLGGSSMDLGYGLAVDSGGSAYITGHTSSSNFPATLGAYDTSFNGSSDAFVAKLNAAGTALTYATYLGGSGWDAQSSIAIDSGGAAYISGKTQSTDFPVTLGAFDTSANGWYDAFVVKLNADGSALSYATLLGGNQQDTGYAIAVDSGGAAYVTGETYSSDFPVVSGGFDTSFGGITDAFLVKLNATGSGLTYATYLGGSDEDTSKGIVIGSDGAAYITGLTTSSDFPATAGAYDTSLNGEPDAFIGKLSADGTTLTYATYLGGNDFDMGYDIGLDSSSAVYITGLTSSSDFPTTFGAYDTSFNGGTYDAFVAKLNAAGTALAYATFLGTSDDDRGHDLALDSGGAACVTGFTDSAAFPTTAGAYDTSFNGFGDAIVIKLDTPLTQIHSLTFKSLAAQDGWVLEKSEASTQGGSLNATTNTLRLGDDAAQKQYRSILSFNTSSLPNTAVITKVTLKLRKQSVTGGGDPIVTFQGLKADVKQGFFGFASTLTAGDFQAQASKAYGPLTVTLANGWYGVNLTTAKAYINKLATNGGLTQFRLRFTLDDNNDAVANYLSLYSGNASTISQPQLIIEYYVP